MGSRRELIERNDKKYFVRRDEVNGQFVEWDEVGWSVAPRRPTAAGQADGPARSG